MSKYQNKYRVESTRLQNWNYGWDGAYFITICTKEREHYFGNISDNKMKLSSIGILADVFWHEIKNHAKNIILDEFVVMPNHIHGILILNDNNSDNKGNGGNGNVETRHALSLQSQKSPQSQPTQKTIGQQRFQNQGKNTISSIIGSYKSAVSKHAHRLGYEFEWQSKFYDHIIKNEKSFENIRSYIYNNPENWEKDKFYSN